MPKAARTKKTKPQDAVAPYPSSPTKKSKSGNANHPLGDGPAFVYTPPNKSNTSTLPEASGFASAAEASPSSVTKSFAEPTDAVGGASAESGFELPDVTGMSWREIMRLFGFEVTPEGEVVLHKKGKWMDVDSRLTFFNGKNLRIVFADYDEEYNVLTMKLRLTPENEANLRALQNAWVSLYYKYADKLAEADSRFVEAKKWLRKIKNAWRDWHEENNMKVPPLPEDWREVWSHDSMKETKSGKKGTYDVNIFFADKIVKKGDHNALLKVDYPAADKKNCGPTIRKIEDGSINVVDTDTVNGGDTVVKGRFRIALGTHNGAPAWNIKCYNGGGRQFLIDDTGRKKTESREAREARLATETPEERAAREAREAAKRQREDEADLEMAKRLRASR